MEIFDVVDEYGHPTGMTCERAKAHAEGIRHHTAHVWLVRTKNEAVQALLQKRSADKDSFPGCLDTSSAGHIPAGCEPVESALRELREELGLSFMPDDLNYAGSFVNRYEAEFHGKLFRDNEISFVYVLERDIPESEITVQPEELETVEWHDFSELCAAVETGDKRWCVTKKGLGVLRTYLSEHQIKA